MAVITAVGRPLNEEAAALAPVITVTVVQGATALVLLLLNTVRALCFLFTLPSSSRDTFSISLSIRLRGDTMPGSVRQELIGGGQSWDRRSSSFCSTSLSLRVVRTLLWMRCSVSRTGLASTFIGRGGFASTPSKVGFLVGHLLTKDSYLIIVSYGLRRRLRMAADENRILRGRRICIMNSSSRLIFFRGTACFQQ